VQGFINHCRIAHKIEYASHEDAVRSCGVEIDVAELGTEESARLTHMARPGIQSILNTSSTLSGKLPET
jgi:ADA HAT complex component 1